MPCLRKNGLKREERHRGRRASESAIEIERMEIAVFGGDEYYWNSAGGGAFPQFGQQGPADTLSPMIGPDCNVVDEDFG
jgi:hypothetical protein